MARKKDSGDGDEYTAQEEGEIESALDRAFEAYGDGDPDRVDVTAQIEWAGTVQGGRDGVRTTRLRNLDRAAVRDLRQAVAKARAEAARQRRHRDSQLNRRSARRSGLFELCSVERWADQLREVARH